MKNNTLEFTKYQGTGNDFIIIDDRQNKWDQLPVEQLCNRKFGIGADGLMLLKLESGFDFKMVYYNSDGKLSTMCGNGGRCIAHFAKSLGIGKENELTFSAADGKHTALILGNDVELEMKSVTFWEVQNDSTIINTGSPHYVQFVNSLDQLHEMKLLEIARSIRYNDTYAKEGINVNFVYIDDEDMVYVRTYERGVEDETLSCGTGVTAAALSAAIKFPETFKNEAQITMPGGKLKVRWSRSSNGEFEEVFLLGSARKVFTGFTDI